MTLENVRPTSSMRTSKTERNDQFLASGQKGNLVKFHNPHFLEPPITLRLVRILYSTLRVEQLGYEELRNIGFKGIKIENALNQSIVTISITELHEI